MFRIIYFCISFSVLFAGLRGHENTTLSGKLVKKFYPAPHIVKNPPFGWYLELNKTSQEIILKKFQLLPEETQDIFKEFSIDLKTVQCVDCDDDFLLKARSFEGTFVRIDGNLESPYLARKHLCFSIATDAVHSKLPISSTSISSLDKFDYLYRRSHVNNESLEESISPPLLQLPEGAPEQLVTLKGKLVLRLFSGPPEYSSIERGDRADYCWLLCLDDKSFRIATTTQVPEPACDLESIMSCSNHDEIYLSFDGEMIDFCCAHESKEVVVQGYLFHAHTAHHYTPILMEVKKILQNPKDH